MHNPFARLTKRDTARPSLRERAAILKASASRVIRRKPAGSTLDVIEAVPTAEAAADPIFAMIKEGRRLLRAVEAAFAASADVADGDPRFEARNALLEELFAHVDGRLLKTVPRTTFGCRELARFDVEYADSQEVPISQDEQAITSLIAQSPMWGGSVASSASMDWPAPTGGADTELLALGREFDALHAEWVLACIASQEAEEKAATLSKDLERRKGWTFREINEASLAQPGVTEAMEAGYAMNVRIEEVTAAIRALPARTVDGLAVKARAAIPGIWRDGQYQEDASLGDDEDWTELNARSVIEDCLSLAGVDWRGRRWRSAPGHADGVAPAPLDDAADATPKAPPSAMNLAGVPLDALFAMADLYATGARHFEVGAFWPKLSGGAQRPGQALIIAEGDRLSLAFHAVAEEISRRDPGSDDTLIDQRGEWLMRAAVHDGGWEAMTKIVAETRTALGIEG